MLPVNDFICVKLGKLNTAEGRELDGEQTLQIYARYLLGHHDVWFSTDSLPTGMAEKQVRHYRRLLESGEVRILFAYNDGWCNDIQYSARILEIQSFQAPVGSPDPIMMPDEFRGETRRIWIRITDLRREEKLSAKSFQITSTKRNLKEVMETSQFHFGYVSYL